MVDKELIQKEVGLYKDRKLIILEHATGAGKSFSALRIIEGTKDLNILLIVAEIFHKDNWKNEFDKFHEIYGYDATDNNITVECYASLKNYEDTSWDVVILDEAHHLSDLRSSILSTISTGKLVALSATLNDYVKDFLYGYMKISKPSEYYFSRISLANAIHSGILPEPKVYVIPLNLDFITPSEELVIKWGTSSKRKKVHTTYSDFWHYRSNRKSYPDMELIVKCTPKEKYDYLTREVEYWKNRYMNTGNIGLKNKWLHTALSRKRTLGESKSLQVKKLLLKMGHMRYICFCNSIDQAVGLGKGHAIHSKNKDSDLILEKFQNKEINSIFVVGMLTEGQNLKDIDAGVMIQLDNAPRLYIQKSGRVFRSNYPIQFIFYYKDTQDETYLKNVLNNIPNHLIEEVNNLNDLQL